MCPANPFLPSTIEDDAPTETLESDPVMHAESVSMSGPTAPVYAPRSTSERYTPPPGGVASSSALITVVGLHGGAGASTLATLLGDDAYDAGQMWPTPDPWVTSPEPTTVIAVARTHRRGMEASEAMLSGWIHDELPQHVRLAGLCLVADGAPSKGFDARAVRRVIKAAPHGWYLGWREEFRQGAITSSGLRLPRTLSDMKRRARALRTTK